MHKHLYYLSEPSNSFNAPISTLSALKQTHSQFSCVLPSLGHCCEGGAQEARREVLPTQGGGGGGERPLHGHGQDDWLRGQTQDWPGSPWDCHTSHWWASASLNTEMAGLGLLYKVTHYVGHVSATSTLAGLISCGMTFYMFHLCFCNGQPAWWLHCGTSNLPSSLSYVYCMVDHSGIARILLLILNPIC